MVKTNLSLTNKSYIPSVEENMIVHYLSQDYFKNIWDVVKKWLAEGFSLGNDILKSWSIFSSQWTWMQKIAFKSFFEFIQVQTRLFLILTQMYFNMQ